MKLTRLFAVLSIIAALTGPGYASNDVDRENIYQVSTIDALLGGIYDGVASFGQLKNHGDFGIGTLDALDGEMIALDGSFYQIKSNGVASPIANEVTTPFAAVTFFDRDKTIDINDEMSFSDITALLDSSLGSANLFYAIRIDGTFSLVKTRSVPRQSKPYPKLVDVVKQQPVFELNDVKGSIVGFRCPPFVKGINIPGYHFHFIDSNRTRGGHVLDCRLITGKVYVDVTPAFYMSLPAREDFLQMELGKDLSKDREKVEKDNK